MSVRVAINGFGRIGRCVTRVLFDQGFGDIELVGINDLTDDSMMAHLLNFNSVHGPWAHEARAEDGHLIVGDRRIPVTSQPDPTLLPWKALEVDVVLECTGRFRSQETAGKHLKAGAGRVVISAPGKDVDATFCYGINTDSFDADNHKIVSNASCTTNCLAPIAQVLHETVGIIKGHMVTIHSYTNDQRILDLPHKDMRRARAAALSIIPTTTGAAKAIGLVLPELAGKLEGVAVRVPTPNVSMVCLTAHVQRNTTREEILAAMKAAAEGKLKGILGYEERPLVSNDYIGNPCSSTLDVAQTQVIGGDLVELHAWYDNEWGFSNRMIDLTRLIGSKG